MKSNEPINISLSAVNAYRQCQQLYSYRYVEKLKVKTRGIALERGSILHTYLENYYVCISDANDDLPNAPKEAHEYAKAATTKEYATTSKKYARAYLNAGMTKEAQEMYDLLAVCGRIADRYFATHGESDAEEYEILYVEEWISVPVITGVVSNGKFDMITRHNDTGRVHLWEHKSAADIPDTMHRLRDLQTTLYNAKINALELPAIDAVNWNYLRTKEPTKPEQLKAGGLTKRQDLDSTWEVYLAELTRLKLNPDDYSEQRTRLEGREPTAFFPRHEQVILAKPGILMRDYVQTAKEIKRSRRAWLEKTRRPVRSLSLNCNWCEMRSLCNAALLTGSDRDERDKYEVKESTH